MSIEQYARALIAELGCSDSSCAFQLKRPTGMRTNGGCRCWYNIDHKHGVRRAMMRLAQAIREQDNEDKAGDR